MSSYKPFEINLADVTSDKIALGEQGLEVSMEGLRDLAVRGVLAQADQTQFLRRDVPIYRIDSSLDRLVLACHPNASACFAHGELIGKFYESNSLKLLRGSFVGQFEGMFEWPSADDPVGAVFFEGKIHCMQLLTRGDERFTDEDISLVASYESTFHGYFRGRFLPWAEVGGSNNVAESLVFRDSRLVRDLEGAVEWNEAARHEVVAIKELTEYILPVLVRFEIKNFGDIDLNKSSAVVNGYLHLELRSTPEVDKIIETQLELARRGGEPFEISLNFNRDFTLKLPLQEEEGSESDSEWSIQDKTWDIEFSHDAASRTYRYSILKRFTAEIDNSYGAFFAPFNLTRLKIVVRLAPLEFTRDSRHYQISFTCVDTCDFPADGPYDPFAGFLSLGEGGGGPSALQVNRYHKINRQWCGDSGEYAIADNFLTIYPHYKLILLNKSFINQDELWGLGLRNPLPLFEPPLAKSIFAAFHGLKRVKEGGGEITEQKFFTFSFQRWNHAIIEVPIYKYIVIDMIKIFVPLTLITVISLLIFQQENGVATGSGFTTLAYRLVNIAAVALVYVSLIPIIRSSLPAMPGVTLIEIITYLETLPSLLAIINSMASYTVPQAEWQATFSVFRDGLFEFGFALSLLNLAAFVGLLAVYKWLPYRCMWRLDHYDRAEVKWRSPHYMAFMDSIRIHRARYYRLSELASA